MSRTPPNQFSLRRRLFPIAMVLSVFMFLLGLPLVLGLTADSLGPGIAVLMITGLPALTMGGIGFGLLGVSIRLEGDRKPGRIVFRLPHAGSFPFFFLTLHRRDISLNDVSRIDVAVRPNAASADGTERLYHIRTREGSFYFNSIWFSNSDDFAMWATKRLVQVREGTPDEIMAASESTSPSIVEHSVRGCGWILSVLLVLIALGSVLVLIFGDAPNRIGALQALVIAGAALGAIPMITRYRRLK